VAISGLLAWFWLDLAHVSHITPIYHLIQINYAVSRGGSSWSLVAISNGQWR
jgi:hypothetical protein